MVVQTNKVWLRLGDDDPSPLDLSDGVTYASEIEGLWDYPNMEFVVSEGYQSEAQVVDVWPVGREIVLNVRNLTGEDE